MLEKNEKIIVDNNFYENIKNILSKAKQKAYKAVNFAISKKSDTV